MVAFFSAKNELVASGFQVLHLSACAGGHGYDSVVLNPDPNSFGHFFVSSFPRAALSCECQKISMSSQKNRFLWDFDVLV